MSSDQRVAAFEPGDEVLDQLEPDEAPTARPTLWQRLADSPNVAITLVALLVFAFFALTTNTFLTEFNLINILRNAALIGIVAVGMTYLLIAGEIDLSVGSVFGFLTVIMGLLVVVLGINPWLAMVGVIALGALIGAHQRADPDPDRHSVVHRHARDARRLPQRRPDRERRAAAHHARPHPVLRVHRRRAVRHPALARAVDAGDHGDRGLRPGAHPLRLSSLRHRRQSRGRAPRRHRHRPGQADRLRPDRRSLRRDRCAAVRLPARRRADHRHRLRVPRDRRRDRRRRRADRRPRHDLRRSDRGADHQHDHERPGSARLLAGRGRHRHGRADHRRRDHRSAGAPRRRRAASGPSGEGWISRLE